jgi:hypothetical protein
LKASSQEGAILALLSKHSAKSKSRLKPVDSVRGLVFLYPVKEESLAAEFQGTYIGMVELV